MTPAHPQPHDSNPSDKPLAASQDVESLDQTEAVIGIRKGLASMERGEGIPAERAFERLRREHNIKKATF